MGRALLYFLAVAIPIAIFLGLVVWAVWAGRSKARRRAIRRARWEFYADPVGGGLLAVGTRRVAYWADHQKVVATDEVGRFASSDEQSTFNARIEAVRRMEFNNSLLPEIEED